MLDDGVTFPIHNGAARSYDIAKLMMSLIHEV